MSITTASNTTAPTHLLRGRNETYAYRRFGSGPARPLLFVQNFTGTRFAWSAVGRIETLEATMAVVPSPHSS
jgi:hypothetical protein